MTTIPVRAKHYMTFVYPITSLAFSAWQKVLMKNGERILDTPIDYREHPTGVYTFSFDNDGDKEATWTLIVNKTGDTDNYYVESWRTQSKVVEQTVKQLRSNQESEGGLFNPKLKES